MATIVVQAFPQVPQLAGAEKSTHPPSHAARPPEQPPSGDASSSGFSPPSSASNSPPSSLAEPWSSPDDPSAPRAPESEPLVEASRAFATLPRLASQSLEHVPSEYDPRPAMEAHEVTPPTKSAPATTQAHAARKTTTMHRTYQARLEQCPEDSKTDSESSRRALIASWLAARHWARFCPRLRRSRRHRFRTIVRTGEEPGLASLPSPSKPPRSACPDRARG